MLVLRYWEDLPIAEVAAALRCSEGTVKSQSSRGLQSLREAIARYDPDLVGVDAEGTA
ncbi:DNA-directed RNA polymerase specialized sigma24 family protein [Saccharopolyspora lacisalsi]|uniref:DNA-directed RNA polymerase specialized sigma24 family protein n=1 Tax=Halosaccharopolyspora lacisalsi TaxID=1000566 RepID=A0A839E453_9PSEU|nr:DNA-directed RNA polymerase specialized sigma24 family protein [Halosaccharopolyspora lacisalsi]